MASQNGSVVLSDEDSPRDPERVLEPARDRERCAPVAPVFLWAGALFALVSGGLATGSPWVVLATAGPLVSLVALGPGWARRSVARFDRDFVSLVARGATDGLAPRLARAVGMRLFADRDLVDERRGRVAMALGDARAARRAYARALAVWRDEDRAPSSVRLGYAHACYALGDDAEASWAYRRITAREGPVPRVAVNLAHALLRRGVEAREVEAALSAARPSDEEERLVLELVRGVLAARRGQVRKARAALGWAGASSPRVEQLRRELWRALHASEASGAAPEASTRRGGRVIALRPRSARSGRE